MSGGNGAAPDADDVVAAVDALVAAVDPNLPAPAASRRNAVLVTGPWLAGTTSVLAALRDRLPEHVYGEPADFASGEVPVAVVFVVSAAAPLTESDCALLDAAAAGADAVIGVVSKIDVHRTWRDVLETNRATLTRHASRYADVAWVGAAAAPDLGSPNVDVLVESVREALNDEGLPRRNHLRAWESRLMALSRRYEGEVEGPGREARLAILREQRGAALRQRRLSKSERAIALRTQVQQARVQLSYFARHRCASVRTELQEDVASMTRRTLAGFGEYVHRRVAEVIDDVDRGVSRHLADVAGELGLSDVDIAAPPAPPLDVPTPPLRSRRLETRLMTLLGAGFGLGVALTLSRLFADLAPGWAAAGAVGCAVIGVALTLWVVGTRGLLHDRAVLDRWVGEVTAGLRTAAEERVATRVLSAESAFSTAAAERDAAESARVDDEVANIDSQIREHSLARTRAAAARDRQLPAIARALVAVRSAGITAGGRAESMNQLD